MMLTKIRAFLPRLMNRLQIVKTQNVQRLSNQMNKKSQNNGISYIF